MYSALRDNTANALNETQRHSNRAVNSFVSFPCKVAVHNKVSYNKTCVCVLDGVILPVTADCVDTSSAMVARPRDTLIHVITTCPTDISGHAATPETVRSGRTATCIAARLRGAVVQLLTSSSCVTHHPLSNLHGGPENAVDNVQGRLLHINDGANAPWKK